MGLDTVHRTSPFGVRMTPAELARIEAIRMLLSQRGAECSRNDLIRKLVSDGLQRLEAKLAPKGTNE